MSGSTPSAEGERAREIVNNAIFATDLDTSDPMIVSFALRLTDCIAAALRAPQPGALSPDDLARVASIRERWANGYGDSAAPAMYNDLAWLLARLTPTRGEGQ